MDNQIIIIAKNWGNNLTQNTFVNLTEDFWEDFITILIQKNSNEINSFIQSNNINFTLKEEDIKEFFTDLVDFYLSQSPLIIDAIPDIKNHPYFINELNLAIDINKTITSLERERLKDLFLSIDEETENEDDKIITDVIKSIERNELKQKFKTYDEAESIEVAASKNYNWLKYAAILIVLLIPIYLLNKKEGKTDVAIENPVKNDTNNISLKNEDFNKLILELDQQIKKVQPKKISLQIYQEEKFGYGNVNPENIEINITNFNSIIQQLQITDSLFKNLDDENKNKVILKIDSLNDLSNSYLYIPNKALNLYLLKDVNKHDISIFMLNSGNIVLLKIKDDFYQIKESNKIQKLKKYKDEILIEAANNLIE